MPSTYSSSLRLELQAAGENAFTWGTKTNNNLNLIEQAITGYTKITLVSASSTYTLPIADASASPGRNAFIEFAGTVASAISVVVPDAAKGYWVKNSATGSNLTFRTSSGTGVTLPTNDWVFLISDGASVVATAPTSLVNYARLNATNTFTATNNLNGSVSVGGAATFASTVDIQSAASLASTLTVGGGANLRSNLSVVGNVLVSGSTLLTSVVDIKGATSLASTLIVTGSAEFKSNVSIMGRLLVPNEIYVGNQLRVGPFSGSWYVNFTSAAAFFNTYALFTSATLFSSSVVFTGDIKVSASAGSSKFFRCYQRAEFNSAVIVSGSFTARGNTTLASTVSFQNASATMSNTKIIVYSDCSLTFEGGSNFTALGVGAPVDVNTNAVNAIAIVNGTAPTASQPQGILLYAEDVAASSELKVRDEAGNVTTLSPHNFSRCGGPSENLAWSHYSENAGKFVNVDMLRLARLVEKITGEKLVFMGDLP